MDRTWTDWDRRTYRDEIEPWLPERIMDIHVHVSLPEHTGPIAPERIAANWAMEVGTAQSWDELRATYAALFPERTVACLAFGGVFRETDSAANNAYVLAGTRNPDNRAAALLCTRPEWSAEQVAQGLGEGFAGIKPYPDLAAGGEGEVSVFDFLPHDHLRVLDDLGGILMLHLPRAGRVGDPQNQREVLEIRSRYPRVKLIVAHIGRAYCLATAQRGLPSLAKDDGIYFDTAANLNADVFRYALDLVGPRRLLFGSDLPITLMRGVREHVGDKYINYTSEPYSWNTNRKSAEEEAHYTFFLYEELRALIEAVRAAGFGRDAMAQILYGNGAQLLESAR
jgi:hypothetical protein